MSQRKCLDFEDEKLRMQPQLVQFEPLWQHLSSTITVCSTIRSGLYRPISLPLKVNTAPLQGGQLTHNDRKAYLCLQRFEAGLSNIRLAA